jgi:hypothetical protein
VYDLFIDRLKIFGKYAAIGEGYFFKETEYKNTGLK